jgi:hypothetical protein
VNFDPRRWLQSVWIHPSRRELEMGYSRTDAQRSLKHKLQQRVTVEQFAPLGRYHATVVVAGVNRYAEGVSLMTATRVFSDSPVGFDDALSYTFHVQLGGSRPLIGLLASEEPLDRGSALAHFHLDGGKGP